MSGGLNGELIGVSVTASRYMAPELLAEASMCLTQGGSNRGRQTSEMGQEREGRWGSMGAIIRGFLALSFPSTPPRPSSACSRFVLVFLAPSFPQHHPGPPLTSVGSS